MKWIEWMNENDEIEILFIILFVFKIFQENNKVH